MQQKQPIQIQVWNLVYRLLEQITQLITNLSIYRHDGIKLNCLQISQPPKGKKSQTNEIENQPPTLNKTNLEMSCKDNLRNLSEQEMTRTSSLQQDLKQSNRETLCFNIKTWVFPWSGIELWTGTRLPTISAESRAPAISWNLTYWSHSVHHTPYLYNNYFQVGSSD